MRLFGVGLRVQGRGSASGRESQRQSQQAVRCQDNCAEQRPSDWPAPLLTALTTQPDGLRAVRISKANCDHHSILTWSFCEKRCIFAYLGIHRVL